MILRKLCRNLILTLIPPASLPSLSLSLPPLLPSVVPPNRDNIIMPDNNIILSAGIFHRLEVN